MRCVVKILYDYMKKSRSGIPKEALSVFDEIMKISDRLQSENTFLTALQENLTEEQRILLFEKHGACKGTGYDKNRLIYRNENKEKSIAERVEHYVSHHIAPFDTKLKHLSYDEELNTLTLTFLCDECYNHVVSGKHTAPTRIYYERCAGGRMYSIEKSLGVKLKIKSMEIPEKIIKNGTPCVYVYEIIEIL